MSGLPDLYLREETESPSKEQAFVLKEQRSRHRLESMQTSTTEYIPREIDFLSETPAGKKTAPKAEKSTSKTSEHSEKKIAKYEKLYYSSKRTGPGNKSALKTVKFTGTKKGVDDKKCVRSKASGEETGISRKAEQEPVTGCPKVRSNTAGSSADVIDTKEIVDLEREPGIQEMQPGSECNVDDDPKQTGESQRMKSEVETHAESSTLEKRNEDEQNGEKLYISEDRCTQTIGSSETEDTFGKEVVKTQASGLPMERPSLPLVTSQTSKDKATADSTQSRAASPIVETDAIIDTRPSSSPSSAIFRKISMRETRESCDLSPKSSYVVLPALTSSESILINTRMEQMLSNEKLKSDEELKSKGFASSSSLPMLSPIPSKEAVRTASSATADQLKEPVKLPSVTSVESCPSRSPTPVRSPLRSSEVALPQIGKDALALAMYVRGCR